MASLPFTILSVVVLLAASEPLQEALTSEDECSADGDCAMNALQHKAVKAQSDNYQEIESQDKDLVDDDLDDAESHRVDIFAESEGWELTLDNAAPGTIEMVAELNRRYDSDDKGVYQRLVYGQAWNPWVNKGKTLSFALMNKAAWNPVKQQITVFDFHGAASGFIAKTSGVEGSLKCMFPCDGYSDHRNLGDTGCGCGDKGNMKGFPCPQAGEADWCDYFGDIDNNFTFRATGTPCAFKPTESSQMLKYYAEVKKGKAPKALQESCNAWGQGADGAAAWNEAVVDAAEWRKDPAGNIIAIVMPSSCYNSMICRNDLNAWYGRFKLYGFGKRPMVYMDLDKHESPYQLFSDGTHMRLPTSEPWPSAQAMSSERDALEKAMAGMTAAGNTAAAQAIQTKLDGLPPITDAQA